MQIAEFSIVTPEQSKVIKPVDTAILKMIPESDADWTTYLIKLLRTKKSEQQKNTFWFPTPENSGRIEDRTAKQTWILEELHDIKEKEKPNRKDKVESPTKLLKPNDWTDRLLTETEKQQWKIF